MAFVVVNRQGNSIASGSLRTSEAEVGEEAAIALAMTASTKIKYESAILKSGFRNDARTGKIYLIWAPAHSGLAGNECAHNAARGFTDRADIDPNTTFAHSITQVEQWETVLLSSDPADQNWAIQLAEATARAQGLLADV
ncbi:hypothetical protein HPB47_007214 [Ixodes persulcatus]|uniref:Uncharacterized protein n=1 Tax=Ixodes persulcatus TaxID=34615 RepID=A0AC60P8U7_IXOPE|nr:hypothetical protein HPB47_007214 [Ixodes persulcatus]